MPKINQERINDQLLELIQVSDKRYSPLDTMLYSYSVLGAMDRFVYANKDKTKGFILDGLPPRSKKTLQTGDTIVSNSGASTKLTVYSSKNFILSAQVRVGAEFVDIDSLKENLGVSQKRWDEAVVKSTKRRNNSTILSVTEPF